MAIIYNKNRKKGLFYIPSGGLGPSVSADFAYSKSSYNQGEADPTPTITGTAGGTFNASANVVFVDTGTFNSSTGQIDLSATTIDSHIITYTVDGVQSGQTVGVTAVPYQSTSSFTFDGINDYFDISNKFDLIHNTKVFSISVWLKMDSYNTTVSSVILGNNYTSLYIGFQFWVDNRQSGSIRTNALKFNLWDGTNTAELAQDSVVTDNNWHNYIVTGDGTTLKYYKDGVQLTDTDSLPASTSSTAFANLRIGANTNLTPSAYLDGNLDEVSIWNTALSQNAITEIAAGPNDLTTLTNASNTNLKAWYKF